MCVPEALLVAEGERTGRVSATAVGRGYKLAGSIVNSSPS